MPRSSTAFTASDRGGFTLKSTEFLVPNGTELIRLSGVTGCMPPSVNRLNVFLPAAVLVERQIALSGDLVVDVQPLAAKLADRFPRHEPQELCAAVVTAIALRGGIVRWQPPRIGQTTSPPP